MQIELRKKTFGPIPFYPAPILLFFQFFSLLGSRNGKKYYLTIFPEWIIIVYYSSHYYYHKFSNQTLVFGWILGIICIFNRTGPIFVLGLAYSPCPMKQNMAWAPEPGLVAVPGFVLKGLLDLVRVGGTPWKWMRKTLGINKKTKTTTKYF